MAAPKHSDNADLIIERTALTSGKKEMISPKHARLMLSAQKLSKVMNGEKVTEAMERYALKGKVQDSFKVNITDSNGASGSITIQANSAVDASIAVSKLPHVKSVRSVDANTKDAMPRRVNRAEAEKALKEGKKVGAIHGDDDAEEFTLQNGKVIAYNYEKSDHTSPIGRGASIPMILNKCYYFSVMDSKVKDAEKSPRVNMPSNKPTGWNGLYDVTVVYNRGASQHTTRGVPQKDLDKQVSQSGLPNVVRVDVKYQR